MTIEQRAEKISREAIQSHASAFYVSATQFQTEKVIADCAAQIAIELRAMLAEYEIKFEP